MRLFCGENLSSKAELNQLNWKRIYLYSIQLIVKDHDFLSEHACNL